MAQYAERGGELAMDSFIGHVALLGVVAFLAFVALGLVHELEALRRRLDYGALSQAGRLPDGSKVPDLNTLDIWSGERIETLTQGTGLIVFISAFCPTCREIPGALTDFLSDDPEVRVILVCSGTPQDCRSISQRLRSKISVICDEYAELVRAFRIVTFPTTMVVDESATLRGTGHPVKARDFRQLVNSYISRSTASAEVKTT
jgi:hypothetical protein